MSDTPDILPKLRFYFIGGKQEGTWGNTTFVASHIAGPGPLGNYLAVYLKGKIKMVDTPSVAYLLHGTSDDPFQPNWRGRFARI